MKLLACISNFGDKNAFYLHQVLAALDKIETFTVDVILHSTSPTNLRRYRFDSKEVICNPEAGRALAFKHRQTMIARQDAYDLFLYSENDTQITEQNLLAFCNESRLLPARYAVGFLRYEQRSDPSDRELYLPDCHPLLGPVLDRVLVLNGKAYAIIANKHQSGFVLTREQLKIAIQSRGFDVIIPNRPLNLEVAATSVYYVCHLTKVLPVDCLDQLMVHHLPDKYVNLDEEPWRRVPPLTLSELKKRIARIQ